MRPELQIYFEIETAPNVVFFSISLKNGSLAHLPKIGAAQKFWTKRSFKQFGKARKIDLETSVLIE